MIPVATLLSVMWGALAAAGCAAGAALVLAAVLAIATRIERGAS